MWCSTQHWNRVCSGALYVRRGGCWRVNRCSQGSSVEFVASLCFVLANYGPFVMFFFQVQLVMFIVSPGLAMCRQKRRCGIREDKNTLSAHVVSFSYRVSSQAQLNLEATSKAAICWSRRLTMLMMSPIDDTLSLVPCGILISLN